MRRDALDAAESVLGKSIVRVSLWLETPRQVSRSRFASPRAPGNPIVPRSLRVDVLGKSIVPRSLRVDVLGKSIVPRSLRVEAPRQVNRSRLASRSRRPAESIVPVSPRLGVLGKSIVPGSRCVETPGKSIVPLSPRVEAPGKSIGASARRAERNDRLAETPGESLKVTCSPSRRRAALFQRRASCPSSFAPLQSVRNVEGSRRERRSPCAGPRSTTLGRTLPGQRVDLPWVLLLWAQLRSLLALGVAAMTSGSHGPRG